VGPPATLDTYNVSLAVTNGTITSNNGTSTTGGSEVVGTVSFNANGSLAAWTPAGTIKMAFAAQPNTTQTITLNMGTATQTNGLTEFGNTSSAAAISQDGASAGALKSITIASDGTVTGNFTNSQTLALAQIAVATFSNPSGLDRVGDNYYQATSSSGTPVVGTAGSGSAGTIQAGALEQSNVDEGTEFTNLILAQQAYQINAKVITSADQTLQSLLTAVIQ
jgi:flagellar hook protein FlgE